METLRTGVSHRFNFVFKSYYVVWKPEPDGSAKSWVAVFKSYYVVWKHDINTKDTVERQCLNRTM